MSINDFFKDMNLSKEDVPYILFLTITTSILIILACFNPNKILHGYDVSIYVFNSIKLSGASLNFYIDPRYLFLSPVLSLPAALLIKMGIDYFLSWALVIGLFHLIAAFSFYIFLKNRFNCLLSLTGAVFLIATTNALNILILSLTDVAAVGLSILTLVFFIAGVNKNPKYYLLASLTFILAIFTRYTAGFTLPLMFFYYLSRHDFFINFDNLISDRREFKNNLIGYLKSSDFKFLLISVAFTILLFYLISKALVSLDSQLGFISQTKSSVTGFKTNHDPYNSADSFFYFLRYKNGLLGKNYSFMGIRIVYLVYSIMIVGLILKVYNLVKNREFIKKIYNDRYAFKTRHLNIVLFASLFVLLGLMYILRHNNTIYVILFFLIAATICLSFLNRLNIDKYNYSLTFLVICMFCVYFIFFSLINIKVHRYIITTYPAFIYLFILALDEIFSVINNKFTPLKDKYLTKAFKFEFDKNTKNNIERGILLLFIIFLLVNSASAINSYEYSPEGHDINDLCDFIINYDPSYQSKDMITLNHYYRYFELNLDKQVDFIPDKEVSNITDSDATYIILNDNLSNPNYHLIHQEGDFTLYQHV